MKALDEQQFGWSPFFQQQLTDEELRTCRPGRIAQVHRTHSIVWTSDGPVKIVTGLFKNPNDVAVGDWLLLPQDSERPKRVLERYTQLVRQSSAATGERQLIACNLDTLFIVTSCNQEFNESRIERYLALAVDAKIQPVIVLTKIDTVGDHSAFRDALVELNPSVPVLCVNAKNRAQVEPMRNWCQGGQTAALVGSSGVGKSTLTNSLSEARQKTSSIRHSDGKGRHTTTYRSLHQLRESGLLIDTPGIRELQLSDCEEGIQGTFDDIEQLACSCKFRSCGHDNEPGCAIQTAISSGELAPRRWQSYLRLRDEQLQNTLKAERRLDRQKKTGHSKKSRSRYDRK